jgi:predicted MFS family arabinose efflux permease
MKMIPSARAVDHPVSVVCAILVFTLGSLNYPLMPLIVGAISDQYGMAPDKVGLIATADTLGMFIASSSALYWVRRVNWRRASLFFGLLLVAAHIASAFSTTLTTLMAARLAAGFCGGALMVLGNIVVGDTQTRERNVALLSLIQMAVVGIAYFIMPPVIAAHGATGAFLCMAAFVLPAAVIGQFIPEAGVWPPPLSANQLAERKVSVSSMGWIIGGTLPVFFFFLAYGASWTYMERIGVAAGLSRLVVGHALSLSIWAAVFGSAVSWIYATRYGQIRPLLVTLVCQLISLGMLLFFAQSAGAFTVAVSIYFLFINFAGAYQIGVALNVDQTGRGAVIFLLMLKAGVTVGPFVASNFVTRQSYVGPIVISALFFTLSFLLSWLVTRAARTTGEFPKLKLQPAT